jgi:hypothetical protein
MRSYNAEILDFYDDQGALLRQVVEGPDDIPDFVKTASKVGHGSDNQLYALVLVDEGQVLRKYATADRGNTWLSTLYFALTKDRLPEEAQKVAAANLIEACEHFNISAPDMLWDYADGPSETNIVDVTDRKATVKVASVSEVEKEEVTYAIERADGSKYYPLRDAAETKTAMDYFERHAGEFVPRERREFAVKVAQEASKGALPLTEKVAAYSGSGWNPAVESHITARGVFLRDAGAPMPAQAKLVKLAQERARLDPEDFAATLEVFDREFGLDALWDRDLADPWYAVTGDYPANFEKVAKGSVETPATYQVGEVTVTEGELRNLAQRGLNTLRSHFGGEFAAEFLKEPLKMFESMPLPQRKFMARLATTHADFTGV